MVKSILLAVPILYLGGLDSFTSGTGS